MDVALLRSYAEQGMTRREIASVLCLPLSTVSNNCTKCGIKTKRPNTNAMRPLCDNTKRVLELRRKGLGYNAIAKQVCISRAAVADCCRRNGLGGQIAEAPNVEEAEVVCYVNRSGFDYVGGYTMAKKPITVRCRDCGRTFERQAHIFRDVVNGTWTAGNECPLCRQDRQEKRKQEQNAEREERRIKAEHDARIKAEQRAKEKADLISRQMEERLAIHVCKNCGEEYCIGVTGYNSGQYCSEKCAKRWAMRIKNDRRIARMKHRKHDTDITLEKLFKRDGGVCYLCGGECDWSDMDSNGNAQSRYPSVDHVRPLSKGGTHTWDNIKLAHRACNTRKRDSEYAPLV